MRLYWWAKVKELCGSSWRQDTTSFLRLTTRKSSALPVEPTSRKIAEIYKVAFSKLDCVKDDCVKDGGAASRGDPPLEGSSSARSTSCSFVRSNKEGKGDVFQGHLQCLFVVGV